jgi:signal recognition particle subunit SEC65
MSRSTTQDQWLNTVIDQLHSLEGVECENEEDGRVSLTISYDGDTREVYLAISDTDYRTQKIQYSQLRKTLENLGIKEGQTFVAAKLPRRPMTPQMRAAREKQKATFDAWQEVGQTLRKAEKALDVDYEITQMRDYY